MLIDFFIQIYLRSLKAEEYHKKIYLSEFYFFCYAKNSNQVCNPSEDVSNFFEKGVMVNEGRGIIDWGWG